MWNLLRRAGSQLSGWHNAAMSQPTASTDMWWVWGLRALWLSLPFTAGQAFEAALDGASRPVELTATIGLWALWGVAMVLTVIPHTLTLTPLRILAPASFALMLWAVLADEATGWGVVGLALSAVAALVSLSPPVGASFVNGSSYGDEWRAPLRPPGQLLFGPIPISWALAVAGVVAGPMLLAAKQWIAGAIVVLIGFPLAAVAGRSLHGLARRWLVFVPAGVVVHDPMILPDPVLFKRNGLARFGPALADTSATDLSQRALGLALELQLRKPVELSYRPSPGAEPTSSELDAVVISVSRPGAILAAANSRRVPVG